MRATKGKAGSRSRRRSTQRSEIESNAKSKTWSERPALKRGIPRNGHSNLPVQPGFGDRRTTDEH